MCASSDVSNLRSRVCPSARTSRRPSSSSLPSGPRGRASSARERRTRRRRFTTTLRGRSGAECALNGSAKPGAPSARRAPISRHRRPSPHRRAGGSSRWCSRLPAGLMGPRRPASAAGRPARVRRLRLRQLAVSECWKLRQSDGDQLAGLPVTRPAFRNPPALREYCRLLP